MNIIVTFIFIIEEIQVMHDKKWQSQDETQAVWPGSLHVLDTIYSILTLFYLKSRVSKTKSEMVLLSTSILSNTILLS